MSVTRGEHNKAEGQKGDAPFRISRQMRPSLSETHTHASGCQRRKREAGARDGGLTDVGVVYLGEKADFRGRHRVLFW